MAENGNGVVEKSPLQSKKFIAFLVAYLSQMGLAVLILAWAWNLDEVSTRVFFLLLAIVIVTGFLAVGYILGVAALDKYTRLAQIAANGAVNGRTNGSLNKVLAKGTKGMVHVSDEKPVADSEDETEPDPEP